MRCRLFLSRSFLEEPVPVPVRRAGRLPELVCGGEAKPCLLYLKLQFQSQ
jgi:hypothetical protein